MRNVGNQGRKTEEEQKEEEEKSQVHSMKTGDRQQRIPYPERF